MNSNESKMWAEAMKEKMNFLTENETFPLTLLPRSKEGVGGP